MHGYTLLYYSSNIVIIDGHALAYLKYVSYYSYTFDLGQLMAKLVAWESLIGWFACVNFVYHL